MKAFVFKAFGRVIFELTIEEVQEDKPEYEAAIGHSVGFIPDAPDREDLEMPQRIRWERGL